MVEGSAGLGDAPTGGLDAVIFDWGGTLTQWHDIDFRAEAMALAEAVIGGGHAPESLAQQLLDAGARVWGRSRDHQQSSTVADLFAEAGLEHDPQALSAYHDFWEPHTFTDPEVRPMFEALHQRGLRVGVLSNTLFPRAWHRGYFERDGVLDLIHGDVYTSEIAWTKPSVHAFHAAMAAVGVEDAKRCVYVGDRLYDDVWGAQSAGMRAILIPHSTIPDAQRGHAEGVPDAVAASLSDIPGIVDDWR